MTFDAVLAWFAALVGRNVHAIVYVSGLAVTTLDGLLEQGVLQEQKPEIGPVTAFEIGSAMFGLVEQLFVSAEQIGSSLTIQLCDGVELVVFPWRPPEAGADMGRA